jgi:hypothetical protein
MCAHCFKKEQAKVQGTQGQQAVADRALQIIVTGVEHCEVLVHVCALF